jgi:receptor protein-tyrosine kinase
MSIVERALQKAGALGRARGIDGMSPTRQPDAPANGRSRLTAGRDADFPDGGRFVEIQPEALRTVGLAAPPDMEHVIAEEMRLIKRPLLLNAENEDAHLTNGNLVMIASALPGAGKTYLSLNLALSMASELDWTVLLIDADVTRPTLSRKLGLGDAPGLVNTLEHEHDFTEYVFKTNVPGLHVLPAGPARPNVKELLGSQRMRALVAALTEHHRRRVVLFDSPPLLLTSEARVLASYVGQVLMVVEAGHTPRRSVLDALETLDQTKAINLVLNKNWQPLGIGDYHYAGYGPYGYGRDGEEKNEG